MNKPNCCEKCNKKASGLGDAAYLCIDSMCECHIQKAGTTKTVSAKLGKYTATITFKDDFLEEKAQDIVNKKVARMYLKTELDSLAAELSFLRQEAYGE